MASPNSAAKYFKAAKGKRKQAHNSPEDKTGPKHPGSFLSHYPLRVSLVVVMTVLAALGLCFSGVITTSTLQHFMISRVDDQLLNATTGWAYRTTDDDLGSDRSDGSSTGTNRPPTDFFVRVVDEELSFEPLNSIFDSAPELRGLEEPSKPVTVPARSGSASNAPWRAASVENRNGTVTIVALPLEGEEHTIKRLVYLQVIIGLITVASVMAVSLYLIRRALRPLNKVEATASLISQGQLGQRVPNWEPNTEVGRLSQAFNRMLAQIQGAFMAVGASERQARKSEATMRRFIGDASHELRTPLTSVRGYAELYRSGATDDADMVVQKISEEAERMGLLVEDLLALVRMDEGRPLQHNRVDVLELVLQAADGARAGHPDRKISVENHFGSIPVVRGDANRLHQVISNLLTNALKHAGEYAEVKISLRKLSTGLVTIDVDDNGIGMSVEALPHIFERFYRPDVSRSRASGGSGLGLSIVQSLVKAHGGSITVESEEGEGTRFRIQLPVMAEEGGAEEETTQRDDADSESEHEKEDSPGHTSPED